MEPLVHTVHNESLSEPAPVNVLVSLLIFLSIITVSGNAIVILVILKDPCRNLKKIASIVFIVNLAIADLLLGLVIEPIYCVFLLSLVPPENLDYLSSILGFAVEASCLTLVVLAIERWIVVEMPLRAKRIHTPRRLSVTIGIIWFMAGLAACFPWFSSFSKLNKDIKIDFADFFMFDIFGPLLCITLVCVYGRIWVLVRRATSFRMKLTNNNNKDEKQPLVVAETHEQVIRKERIREAKVTRSLYLVCGAFIICWMPAATYIYVKGKDNTTSFRFCLLAGLLNSALNPVIYSLRSARFKQAIRKMLSRKSRQR